AVFLHYSKPQENPAALNVAVFSPEIGTLWHGSISPNGRMMAIVAADSSGKNHLWIRPLESDSAKQLPDTEEAKWPFWSPDSQYIGFFADNKLKKIEVPDGRPEVICNTEQDTFGATWAKNGIILFSGREVIYRVNASGGTPEKITKLDANHEG